MEASDKDGLTRGYGAVLWQPAEFWTAVWDYLTLNEAGNALRTAWTVTGRTAIVLDSERSRRGRLTYAELAAEVAQRRGARGTGSAATRTVLSYVKKPLRHNEVAESSGAVEPGADRS